ncbi:MAG TPA: GNAT family N-acetyltransferase [Desulfonatronum sp.]|nr:GNAT family N-acetyltransferase [Desulfonatronum sp.]
MICKEKVHYLEMTDPGQLVAPKRRAEELEVRKFSRPLPEMNRFFYQTIGKDWNWTERLPWDFAQWASYLSQPGLETWLALHDSTPAGYFELLPDADGGVEIVMFGLLTPFTGQGLGGHLLCFAVRRAWAMGPHRVWLHTSSLDHPHALAHYQARGFRLTRVEEQDKLMPVSAPNAWGEYPGDPLNP